MIDGCAAWNAHVLSAHVEKSEIWTVGIDPVAMKRRRKNGETELDAIQCLLCDGSFPPEGIKLHFTRTHLPALPTGYVSCVECDERHQGEEERTSPITGIDAWNEHVQLAHSDLSWYFMVRKSSAVAELSSGIQTKRVGKRRKIEGSGTGLDALGGCSSSSIITSYVIDVSEEELSDDTPSLEHSIASQASLDEPNTPAPNERINLKLIDPQLLSKEDMKAGGRIDR